MDNTCVYGKIWWMWFCTTIWNSIFNIASGVEIRRVMEKSILEHVWCPDASCWRHGKNETKLQLYQNKIQILLYLKPSCRYYDINLMSWWQATLLWYQAMFLGTPLIKWFWTSKHHMPVHKFCWQQIKHEIYTVWYIGYFKCW